MAQVRTNPPILYISPLEYSPQEIFHEEFFTPSVKRLLAEGIEQLRFTKEQEKDVNSNVEMLAATYGNMALIWLGLIQKFVNSYGVLDSFHAIMLTLAILNVSQAEKLLSHGLYRTLAQHQLARLNRTIRLEQVLGTSVADIDVDRALTEIDNPEGMGMAVAKLKDMLDTPSTKTSFDDIIGVENVIVLLRESVILSSLPPNHLSLDGMKGLIFFGMPGTGKSILVEAFSNESKRKQASLTPSNLTSAYTGVTEKAISMLFKEMRQQPSVVFIDEIDLVFVNREQSNVNVPVYVTYLQSQIMQETSRTGMQNNNIYFMAATNYIKNVDPAILSRLQKPIFIPLPSYKSRRNFFEKTFIKQKIEFDAEDIDTLASNTPFFSGRDLSIYLAQILSTMLVETLKAEYFYVQDTQHLFTNRLDQSTVNRKALMVPFLGNAPNQFATIEGEIDIEKLDRRSIYKLNAEQKIDFSIYGIPRYDRIYASKLNYTSTTSEEKYTKFIAENKEFIDPNASLEVVLNFYRNQVLISID